MHDAVSAICDHRVIRALIADLGGVWWAQTPDAIVFDAEWLRQTYGPQRAEEAEIHSEPEVADVHAA